MTRTTSATLIAFVLLAGLILATGGCNGFQISAGGPPAQPNLPELQPDDDEFARAADRKPTPKTLYVLAKLYVSQGRLGEAEAVFRYVLREHPQFLPVYCELAEVQLRQQRIDDAMKTLQAGLKIAPREPVLLNDLGMCFVLKRQYEAALQQFVSAAAVRPDEKRYRSNAALALGMMGRYDEATSLYRQTVAPADVHYNMGVICEARNDFARAKQEFALAEAIRTGQVTLPVPPAEKAPVAAEPAAPKADVAKAPAPKAAKAPAMPLLAIAAPATQPSTQPVAGRGTSTTSSVDFLGQRSPLRPLHQTAAWLSRSAADEVAADPTISH